VEMIFRAFYHAVNGIASRSPIRLRQGL